MGLTAAALLAAAGAAAWVERAPLTAWCCVRCLTRATDADRAAWADRVAGLGEDAEPTVLGCLSQGDDAACRGAGAVLERWAGQWGSDDPRAAALAGRLAKGFADFSSPGRRVALDAAAGWFSPAAAPPGAALLGACASLTTGAANAGEPEVHLAGLTLCSLALDRAEDCPELLGAGRELVKHALRDEPIGNRLRAVQLAVHPSMDVTEEVASLLKDSAPQVRRAALLALGPAGEEAAPANRLLPLLHDEDAEVRAACEEVLRKDRKLSPQCYKIGWCLYHPDPAQRLNVLDYLQRGADVEPGAWLRELSHDPAPSVRLAAVRACASRTGSTSATDWSRWPAATPARPSARWPGCIRNGRRRPPRPAWTASGPFQDVG